MQRRGLIGAAALLAWLLAFGLAPAGAQEPIVFGVITPLSPPGETALGQLAKRGAEIGAEYINEKGGVLGRKVELSIQDSAGKNEQGVAAYRRLVSSEKAVAVFGFIHSRRQHRRQRGGQGDGRADHGHPDRRRRRHGQALRHRLPHPCGRSAARRHLARLDQEEQASSACQRRWPRPPTTASGSPRRPRSRTRSKNLGLEIQTIMFDRTTTDLLPQLLQVKAFKPDAIINVGVGQPLDLMITQAHTVGLLPGAPMVTSYDAPARPQYWQLHGDKGVGINFIAFYAPKSELSAMSARSSPSDTRRNSTSRRSMRRSTASPTRSCSPQAIEMAKTTEPKAMIKALEEGSFKGWSTVPGDLPAGGRRAVAQLVAAADGPANTRPRIRRRPTPRWPTCSASSKLSGPTRRSPGASAGSRMPQARRERLGPVMFSTELLIQTLLSGLMVGVLYALMALGITFIYSIVRTINWAMGEFYMIGSYIQYRGRAFAARAGAGGGWRHHLDAPARS